MFEIINGQLTIKNLKILELKSGEHILGNHSHLYSEFMYLMKGKATYKLKNLFSHEEETYQLSEGDLMFRTGFISHAGLFESDSVIIEGASESFIDPFFNDIVDKIL